MEVGVGTGVGEGCGATVIGNGSETSVGAQAETSEASANLRNARRGRRPFIAKLYHNRFPLQGKNTGLVTRSEVTWRLLLCFAVQEWEGLNERVTVKKQAG